MIISVAGNILSGKSTLAKKISSLYGYTYVPVKRNELSFLDNFFDNIPLYFFPTQTSFLISKVLEIDSEIKKNRNLVIDRSLFEDVNIFAQLWIDNYDIDQREKTLYKKLSDYIIHSVPQTDIYIYCKCKESTLFERFSKRKRRSFEEKYPEDYLHQLCKKYDNIDFPSDSIVIEVDSEYIDFNNDNEVIKLMSFIEKHINTVEENRQLSFFSQDTEKEEHNPFIKVRNSYIPNGSVQSDFKLSKRTIYVAAPFTEFALEKPDYFNDLGLLVNEEREYYILPTKYQRFLNRIKKYILSLGEYEVILPHKDENNWGKTYISNEQVIAGMINNINTSDLIVAIVSKSIGVHMEIAMMAALNKPMVLFVVDNLSNGFYANGFRNRKHTLVLNVKSIEQVEDVLKSDVVTTFIQGEI